MEKPLQQCAFCPDGKHDGVKVLLTGAAGFIGSALITELNQCGYSDLVLADRFTGDGKNRYLAGKAFSERIEASELFHRLKHQPDIDFVFHLGGRTAEKDDFVNQNVLYAQELFRWCAQHKVPFLYASSSSTYGSGSLGYDDSEEQLHLLAPLNDYGKSKHAFDQWACTQKPDFPWAGLKIFNVFGANEYHKGVSASVAFKSFFEIRDTGKVVLFGSSSPAYGPGEQLRDFIYVQDVVRVFCWFLMQYQRRAMPSGIYNLGTGRGRSFNDVARSVFRAIGATEHIEYKPIPEKILAGYPEKTVARIDKLRRAGYLQPMTALEDAIEDLVKNYLQTQRVM